jgi:hypothetical protein
MNHGFGAGTLFFPLGAAGAFCPRHSPELGVSSESTERGSCLLNQIDGQAPTLYFTKRSDLPLVLGPVDLTPVFLPGSR